jgi:hypothetical protein
VIQEWYFTQPELTLVVFSIKLMIPQSLKHNVEMPFMFFLALRIDLNVINEDLNKLVQLCHVHQVHEVSGGTGQPEGHQQILIEVISGGESIFGNIFFKDPYLMITQSKINLGEHMHSIQLIKQKINVG